MNKRTQSVVALTVVLCLTGACRRGQNGETAGRAEPLAVQATASPAGADSGEPQLTSSPRGVILSWLERAGEQTALKYAERTASGWTPPKTVATGDDWFVNYADVPSVIRKADGTLVANWLVETDPALEAYNLLLSYSRDEGRTWATPFMPHHDGTLTQHGFASFFELPDNGLGLVWLDGRAQGKDPDGAMSLRAATFDASWKQTSDTAIDTRVCECCPTTTAVTADGAITAFRDRSETNVRDIYVSRLENGSWTEGRAVHDDGWILDACPINGPMLSARGRTVAVAWFTTKDDRGHAYASFSTDAGRSWGTPIQLDESASLGYVDVELLDDGAAMATWIEFANQRAQLRARRVEPSGMRSEAVTIAGATGGRPTGYPRVVRQGAELVFAWTETTAPTGEGTEGMQQIKTAVARVPRTTAAQ